jgi:inhibitor of KinA sporulation pathway (predicted exonuclease)
VTGVQTCALPIFINEKENLNIRYVNICSLIKGYYELKNDPGLFRLYQTYYDVDENQLHDALDDAEVTLSVYKAFLDEVNHKINKVREIRNKFE